MLAERRVDGLIWLDQRVSPRMISRIRELGVPVVLIQMPNDDPRTSSVCIETRDGSADAVRHLLELGYKRIALVTGPKGAVDSDYKLAGAMRAFREFGIEIPSHDILEGHHLASFAVKAIGERFATRPRPDAIFAFNDEMAIAIVLWLREQGFRVPEDVAVVGFDGIPEARLMGLTTVETPLYDMGVVAAQLLIEAIKSPASHQNARQVVLKGQLCIRETCGAKLKQARIRPSPPA
jgi:DNA-binding LacI/PurR family transcriptional regulator